MPTSWRASWQQSGNCRLCLTSPVLWPTSQQGFGTSRTVAGELATGLYGGGLDGVGGKA